MYAYEAARLRGGELALWNPFQAAGHPMLGVLQPALLYPARLLLLVFDVPTALRLSLLAHLSLASGAMYATCRAVGSRRSGAAAGALVLVFTGLTRWFTMPMLFESFVWLPVSAAALTRFVSGGERRWIVVAGFALALSVLAGGYQASLYCAYGVALLALASVADPRRRRIPLQHAIAGIAASAILGLALAAPQILPTLAWAQETVRQATPLTDAQIQPFDSVTPARLALAAIWRERGPLGACYLSVPVIALAVVGWLRSGRFGAVIGIGAVVLYLLSLGPATPWFGAYRLLPGFATFRIPMRLMVLVAFLVSVGVSLAPGRILVEPTRASRRRLIDLVALAAVAIGVLVPLRGETLFPWNAPAGWRASSDALFAALAAPTEGGRAAIVAETGIPPKWATGHGVPVLQDYEPLSSLRLGTYLTAVAGGAGIDRTERWQFNGALQPGNSGLSATSPRSPGRADRRGARDSTAAIGQCAARATRRDRRSHHLPRRDGAIAGVSRRTSSLARR